MRPPRHSCCDPQSDGGWCACAHRDTLAVTPRLTVAGVHAPTATLFVDTLAHLRLYTWGAMRLGSAHAAAAAELRAAVFGSGLPLPPPLLKVGLKAAAEVGRSGLGIVPMMGGLVVIPAHFIDSYRSELPPGGVVMTQPDLVKSEQEFPLSNNPFARVQGSEFRVWVSGLGFEGLGFRV